VDGKVVWKGGSTATELAGYVVSFESEDKMTGGSGVIQPDGSFTIGTFAEADGAIAGKHRVAITPPEFEPDTVPPPSLVAKRFEDFETSGLTAEISADGGPVVLEVERSGR
jgi:hypothetical protein